MAKAKKKAKKVKAKKRTLPAALRAKFTPSEVLANVIGSGTITRQEALKKLWDYFKKNKLNKGRDISADEKLKPLFGKDKITMFEVGKILKDNLTPAS
jgi:chromatin remodeling complex protein RSC6